MFYRSIKATVSIDKIVFSTSYKPDYMRQIYQYVSKDRVLGITKKQVIEVQKDNIKRVLPKVKNIIYNG
jgi:cell division protein FtsL